MEHERRVSARLTRGVAADVDLPTQRLGATPRYHAGHRDMPPTVSQPGLLATNSLGPHEARPGAGGPLASKDDISMPQRSTRQPKK